MRDRTARRAIGSLRLRHRDRGASAVEFALLVVPLLTLVCGGIDFGLAMQQRAMVSEAARAAVRAASLGGTSARVEAVAKQMTDQTAVVAVDCVSPTGESCSLGQPNNIGATIRITVTTRYHGITGLFQDLVNVPLTASSTMVVES